MKKIALSLASVLAAAAFAPEASALPLFARQTGMACNACHYMNFPMLNQFGRAFKASGFTLMGAQGRIEGEKVSIPDTVNMALLTSLGYTSVNTVKGSSAPKTNANGNGFFVPGTGGEFSVFLGGKISDFAGGLAELGFANTSGNGQLASSKIAMLPEFAGGHAGLVFFTTADKGAAYGFETLNTGAVGVHTMFFVAGDGNGSIQSTLSAQQYIGTGVSATGASMVASNDMGFINLTKYHMVGVGDTGGTGASLSSTYARLVGTFDLAGWDSAVGVASWSGVSYNSTIQVNNTTAAGTYDTKAWAVDGQMQGEIGKMPVGFYVSYATAPSESPDGVAAGTYGKGNAFNLGPVSKHSFNISTEVGVIPDEISVGAAIRRAQNGQTNDGTSGGTALTDNALLFNVQYKLRQNMLVNLVYTKQSGTAWDTVNNNTNGINNGGDRQISASMSVMY